MDISVVSTALQTLAKVVSDVKNNVLGYYSDNSLSEATKLLRVEPLTIVSRDLASLDYMPDVMQSMLSIFSAYYLQAVNMLTKVNDVHVLRMLDRLNPDRDETAFLLAAESSHPTMPTMCLENYKHQLPKGVIAASLEASGDTDNVKFINEQSNLSVGKILNVDICTGEAQGTDKDGKPNRPKTITIPISVRLATSLVASSTAVHLLALKAEDTSLVERYHAWRSGRIQFVRDLIWCQDLIDEMKRAMIGDESGTIQEIIRRVNNSKKFGMLTKNPSLVAASNIFIISESNAKELEQKLNGSLHNLKTRQKAFDGTYAMIIAVVDRNFNRVTIYTRGIEAPTDVNIRELKAANKGNGIDIADLLRNMNSGMPISF